MTLHTQDGTQLSKTAATALFTPVTDTDPLIKATVNIDERYDQDGADPRFPYDGKRLAIRKGQVIRTSVLNEYFPAATVDSISPATGPAAGGTAVTIKGKNFTPGSVPKIGNVAATTVVVIDAQTITCVSPAKTAGTHDVTVTTDANTATKASAFVTT
ncbi:IPT/TIG domain-containing protein [Streptosporangium sp. NPDC051022]|uniref:IPT/TIG domain-containing protein n=1 Tax=Streptosporangium sp. NPDC051022 TaxID=3155752 RepID=UPI003444E6CD